MKNTRTRRGDSNSSFTGSAPVITTGGVRATTVERGGAASRVLTG